MTESRETAWGRLKSRLEAVPLFWKVYGLLVGFIALEVMTVEMVGEPLAERLLTGLGASYRFWQEVALWFASIVFPSWAYCYLLSRIITGKLGRIAGASRALASGGMGVRLNVTGNRKDAFDVLSRSFNEMADTITAQRQNERRLLADISHELRSPLARISVATDIIARRDKGGELKDMTRRIEKELGRMTETISLLLERTRDGAVRPGIGRVELGAMICGIAEDFSFQAEAAGKRVKAEAKGVLPVLGDAPQLERMLGNVVANAVFYGPLGKDVLIEAALEDGVIRVSVRDFGPGVPDGELEDIFRAFYRVDGSRSRGSGGVGLGLALAREAAIQHGGDIAAENAAPGLRVTVTLPEYEEDPDE
ncbi:MAG: HAMP domain-containing histidine kinase [Deltaproteobacteria bacterium]|jgi:two-component system sensor histidine kinase CpxA|nr:HAMP domain-containing histidine kinase [Deltaproteobacteria bacterium]